MRRTYVFVDLIRFAALSKERKDLKPIEVKKLYDELRDKGIKSVCPKCDGKGEYYKLIPNGRVLVDCDCKKQTVL